MPYTRDQLSIMARLHGMLEFDCPEENSQFTQVFTAMHEHAGIPVETISTGLNGSVPRILSWMKGQELPAREEWPDLMSQVMEFLWDLMDEAKRPILE